MVPAEADAFVTAYLDPSAGQKMNLLSLTDKFPDLGNRAKLSSSVDDMIDETLAESGTELTHQDIRPWLGSQLGAWFELGDDGTPHVAVMVSTTDPEAARAAIDELATQDLTVSEHDGVEISEGEPDGAYAIVNGVVVVASDAAIVRRTIDAANGTVPTLGSSEIYLDTVDALPDGKLGLAFANVGSLLDQIPEELTSASMGAGGLGGLGGLAGLGGSGDTEAVEAIAVSVSAEPDGIALDMTTNYDPAKLSPETRDQLTASDSENITLASVPADAFAVMAQKHLDVGLRGALDALEQQGPPDVGTAIDELGINRLVEAMNGDVALEIGPGTDGPVSGALLVGADDPDAMQTFLDGLAKLATRSIPFPGGPSSYTGPTPESLPTEEYQGVTITYLDEPSLAQAGFRPAYAVVEGAGVIATSPDEIRQLIDTKASGDDISSAPVYSSATARVPTSESVFFLDVRAIAATIRENLPPDAQQTYDEEVAPNLSPITAFVIGSESDEEGQTLRMFLQIT